MSKKLIIIVGFIIIFIIIIKVGVTGVEAYLEYRSDRDYMREQAFNIAQEYVEQKFQQDMVYLYHYEYAPLAQWSVYYSPSKNQDIIFNVSLQENVEKSITSETRVRVMDDNYYEQFFEYELKELYQPDIQNIWGSGCTCSIALDYISEKDELLLNEDSNLEDVWHLVDGQHGLSIECPYDIEKENINILSEKLWETIKLLREKSYQPQVIYIESIARDGDTYHILSYIAIYDKDMKHLHDESQVRDYIAQELE